MSTTSTTLLFVLRLIITLLRLSGVNPMTEKHSWYEAEQRRKKIAHAKWLKHREHEAEMARVAERLDKERA
jgi:hypothetical protein